MVFRLTSLLTVTAGALLAALPTSAQAGRTVTTVETIEIWIEDGAAETGMVRADDAIGQYGPFRMIAPDTAQMAGTVDSYTPGAFQRLMKDYPGLRHLEMVDCPGSIDDAANLELAHMVRRAGIATHVPPGGSVRSGAVELFLAGIRRTAALDAEFAVHSWQDEEGRGPADYAADDPVNRDYIDYHRYIGLSVEEARAFYALTNSVPFEQSLRLSARDLAEFGLIDGDLELDLSVNLLSAALAGG